MFSIGANCYEMNLSTLLALEKKIYCASKYTIYDFIYDYNSFTKLKTSLKGKELVSKDNSIVINSSTIGSIYQKDYYCYKEKYSQQFDAITIDLIDVYDNNEIKEIYHIIPLDYYYLYEEYLKQNKRLVKFHTNDHMAVFKEINKDSVHVIDSFYGFNGIIPQRKFQQSIIQMKRNPSVKYLKLKVETKDYNTIKEMFYKYLFSIPAEQQININNKTMLKNYQALNELNNNIVDHVDELYAMHGKHYALLIGRFLQPVALQKKAFYNLLHIFNDDKNLSNLISSMSNYIKLWSGIDTFCDVSYLKNITIDSYCNRFNKLFGTILSREEEILNQIMSL